MTAHPAGRAPYRWPQREKVIQAAIIRLYRLAGCTVYNLSQARASQQTEGLPDLLVKHPGIGRSWSHEVKGPTGRLSPAQRAFQDLAAACGDDHVVGGLDAAEAQLARFGLMVTTSAGVRMLVPTRRRQVNG